MQVQILTACISVAPIFLFILGGLGVFGLFQAGPREVPKDHRLNRLASSTFLLLAIGIYMVGSANETILIAGLALSFLALVLYGFIYREARKDFPEMSPEEWMNHLKTRYKFMNDKNPPEAKKKEED